MTERTDSGVALRQAVTEPVHPKKRHGMSEEVGGARCGGLQGGVRGRLPAGGEGHSHGDLTLGHTPCLFRHLAVEPLKGSEQRD